MGVGPATSLFIDDATGRVVNGCLIQPETKCVAALLFNQDLSGADLRGAVLAAADLTGTAFTGRSWSTPTCNSSTKRLARPG